MNITLATASHATLNVAGWRLPALMFVGVAVGQVAWFNIAFLPLLLFVPVLWAFSQTRWQAFLVVLAYYLSAAAGLPLATYQYFGTGLTFGSLLWLSASVLLALVWAAFWSKSFKPWRLLVTLFILTVPPVGIVGWVNPVLVAGAVFPNFGFFGLALCVALMCVLSKVDLYIAGALVLIMCGVVYSLPVDEPQIDRWHGLQSHYPFDTAKHDFIADYQRQIALKRAIKIVDADVVVVAESAAGRWNERTHSIWQDDQQQKIILIGADQLLSHGYRNIIVKLHGQDASIVYQQRMPVPVSMWQPWWRNGAQPAWLHNPVFEVDGKRIAPLICYEQLIVWPVLHSMLNKPDVLMTFANVWWAKNTNISDIQQLSAQSWARLFGLPLIVALNR